MTTNTTKIILDGETYLLDKTQAEKLGILKKEAQFIHFEDIKIGEVFYFKSQGRGDALYIKDTLDTAIRIWGCDMLDTDAGNVCLGCIFCSDSKLSVLRNGKYVSTK